MAPDDRLEAAAERFADTVHRVIAERVRVSVELERDRYDAELGELRERVRMLEGYVGTLQDAVLSHERERLHSVRADS